MSIINVKVGKIAKIFVPFGDRTVRFGNRTLRFGDRY